MDWGDAPFDIYDLLRKLLIFEYSTVSTYLQVHFDAKSARDTSKKWDGRIFDYIANERLEVATFERGLFV